MIIYAFKAECDLPSVAPIIGYPRAIKMFRNPERYDLFEVLPQTSVSYYTNIYSGQYLSVFSELG